METPKNPNTSLTASHELRALLSIPHSNRRGAWQQRLISCLPKAIFTCGQPEIIYNPAGMTYYNLELPDVLPKSNHYYIPELIDSFLIKEGVGIAIEAHDPKIMVDLSYGDILGFYLHRTFDEPDNHIFKTNKPRAGMIREGVDIVINNVPANVLPIDSLTLLQDILSHLGIKKPEIKLLYLPESEQYEIVFSIDSKQFNPAQTQALIKKIGWFLPRFYSYMACDLSNLGPLIKTQ